MLSCSITIKSIEPSSGKPSSRQRADTRGVSTARTQKGTYAKHCNPRTCTRLTRTTHRNTMTCVTGTERSTQAKRSREKTKTCWRYTDRHIRTQSYASIMRKQTRRINAMNDLPGAAGGLAGGIWLMSLRSFGRERSLIFVSYLSATRADNGTGDS